MRLVVKVLFKHQSIYQMVNMSLVPISKRGATDFELFMKNFSLSTLNSNKYYFISSCVFFLRAPRFPILC